MSTGDTSLFISAETPKKTAVVFNSDSDTDSIATDSTAESEAREEYEVERILMEVPEEEHCYFIKWEGYKLVRSTWEPPESLVGGEILAAWERQKKRIEAGEAEPFNYDEFVKAFEEAEKEKKTKRPRRNAKRRKRGLPIRTYSSEESGEEDMEDGEVENVLADETSGGITAASSKRSASPKTSPNAIKRVKQPDVTRKGLAQKLPRRRVVSDASSSDVDSSSADDHSSSTNSIQYEVITQASRPRKKLKEAVKSRPETTQQKPSAVSSTNDPTSMATPENLAAAPVNKAATMEAATKRSPVTKAPHRAGPSGAGKKSAPNHVAAAGTAKASRDVLANWDVPKNRRERQRVSEATPKNSSDPKFKALSVQGRYQKYGRENERPPDFNALTVVDLTSGKIVPPKAPHVQSVPAKALPSVYFRRTPPSQERRRSLTPPPRERVQTISSNMTMRNADKLAGPICKHWLTIGCHNSARDCDFVHPLSKIGVDHYVEKKSCTCYFWLLNGACAFGPSCHYAHSETGIYSPPPGSGGTYFRVRLPSIDASPPPLPVPRLENVQNPQSIVTITPQSTVHPPGQPACRDWLQGDCRNPPEACPWAHALPTEPYRGNLYSLPKHELFCYWKSKKGACSKGNSCAFSHVDTGVQAGPPGSGESGRTNILPARALPARALPAEAVRTNSIVSKTEATARGLAQRDITCFFWRTRGKCGKSDAECAYAHNNTGIWAAPPRGHSKADSHTTTIDEVVAASRGMSFLKHTAASYWDSKGADADISTEPVESPVQLQAPPMPPPVRENTLRRSSISTSAGSMVRTLSIVFSGNESATQVEVTLELSELNIWSKLVGAEPHLTIDRAILASDFRSIVWDDQLRESDCTVGGIVVSDAAVGQSLVNLCKQHTIGLIAYHPGKKARMLLYPPSDDVWRFLDTDSTWKSDSALRFRLFSEVPGLEDVLTNKPLKALSSLQRRPAVVLAGEQLAKLDSTRLLPARDKWSKGKRAVFLMFPPSHHAEMQFYAKFFGAQKYHVYHSGVAGAWHFFLKSDHSKVVIVQPDIPVWQIPDLKHLLKANNGIFSVGLHRLNSMDEYFLSCERLFPSATAVLVTDEVFLYHPEKALEILNGFIDAIKIKPDSKLVTRPGIKEWLFHLAETSLSAGNDNKHLRLYDAICRLCPPEDEDADDLPNPHPETNLISLSIELFPNYHALRRKDESAATQFLVEWYAGWTIENVGKLRKLYVLYEPKGGFGGALDSTGRWTTNEDPFGWHKKYQHIWFQKPTDVFKGGK